MKTSELHDYAKKIYTKSGVLKNEFKTLDEIKKKILSGHEVKYVNENYNIFLVNNERLMVYCNLNGFESYLEQCEIHACYSM